MSRREQIAELIRRKPATHKELCDLTKAIINESEAAKSKSISKALFALRSKKLIRIEDGVYSWCGSQPSAPAALMLSALEVGQAVIKIVTEQQAEIKRLCEHQKDCDQLMRDNILLKERVAELTVQINQASEPTPNPSERPNA